MTRRTWLTLGLLALGLFLCTAGCKSVGGDRERASCCADSDAEEVALTLPDTSVYLLDSEWLDQEGATRQLAEFARKVEVVAMVFTSCQYACPRIMADLKAIESALSPSELELTRFLLISFDSIGDTPEVLAAHARDHDLDLDRWTLLTGPPEDVREVAAVLGVRFKAHPQLGFSHSNQITVLDTEGVILHRQQGLGASPEATIATIRGAVVPWGQESVTER